ncbi:hypothetical protein CR513_17952, partial [Mucuna pruriens]
MIKFLNQFARMETICLLISLAAQMDWRIFQLDIKSTFLYGYLEENVYFIRCQHEYDLYAKKFGNGDILLVCLYVDNLIFIRNNPNLFEDFKKVMSCKFEMTNIRLMS